jgi:hypothetical protein
LTLAASTRIAVAAGSTANLSFRLPASLTTDRDKENCMAKKAKKADKKSPKKAK